MLGKCCSCRRSDCNEGYIGFEESKSPDAMGKSKNKIYTPPKSGQGNTVKQPERQNQKPSQSPLTVQISKLQADLLMCERIRSEFENHVKSLDLEMDLNMTTGSPIITVPKRKKPEEVKKLLDDFFITFSFAHEDVGTLKEELQKKFDPFIACSTKNGTFRVSCHQSIKEKVELHLTTKTIILPWYLMVFFGRHSNPTPPTLTSRRVEMPFSASLKILKSDGNYVLHVTAQENQLSETISVIFTCLSRLLLRTLPVDPARKLYLDSAEAKQEIQRIEEKKMCAIVVEKDAGLRTNEAGPVLVASSPRGHKVYVYKGSLADIDCDVLVLPQNEGQAEWPPKYQQMLTKDDITRCAAKVGPPPKKRVLLLLGKSRQDGSNLQVIVVHIPSDKDLKTVHDIGETLTEAFTAIRGATVAMPFDLEGNIHLTHKDKQKIIFQAITDSFPEDVPTASLKLYVDQDTEDTSVFCDSIGKILPGRQWTISDELFKRLIQVHVGDIMDGSVKGDVLVNSSSEKLDFKDGQLSQLLVKKTGKKLIDQCKSRYPDGMDNQVVAVTDTFSMTTFKKIFNILLHPLNKEGMEMSHEEWLVTRVQACLALATAMGFTSIVFPALGTGKLQYSADKVAQTMFTTFRQFFSRTPHSSLVDITVVCYHKGTEAIKAFKEAESRFCTKQAAGQESGAPCDTVTPAGTVSICGYLSFVEDAAKEVLALPIPKEFQTQDEILNAADAGQPKFQSTPDTETHSGNDKNMEDDKAGINKKEEVSRLIPAGDGEHEKTLGHNELQSDRALSPADKPKLWSIEVDDLKVEALQVLLGQKFGDNFSTVKKSDGKTNITAKTENPPHDILSKIETLRCEDMQANVESGTSLDCMSQGVEAYIKPLPEQGKIVIFCFEYTAMTKAKHFVGVQTGQIKPTTRGTRKFDHGGETEHRVEQAHFAQTSKQQPIGSGHDATPSLANKPGLWSREFDDIEVEAFQALLGQKFEDNFSTVKKSDGKTNITTKTENPPDDILSKIETLRREDMQAVMESGTSLDCMSQGVEAYIKPLPEQGKVVIFCFEYSAMTKAKHFVNVKIGKIKPTTRGRRRFDDGGGTEHKMEMPHRAQTPKLEPLGPVAMTTRSGRINVSVYKTDITKLPVDAIVNAANEHLRHGGGVAYAIARAAGFALEDEGDELIRKNGPLKVTGVAMTTGGNLPCKKVLHAVGPRWSDYKDKSACCRDLTDTIFNCLQTASQNGFTSLAVSSISSAIFGVPQQTCSECYLAAVKKFDAENGMKTTLTDIHFVDVNDSMVSIIQNTFRSSWNSPVTFQQSGSQSSSASYNNSNSVRNQESGLQSPLMSDSTSLHSIPNRQSEPHNQSELGNRSWQSVPNRQSVPQIPPVSDKRAWHSLTQQSESQNQSVLDTKPLHSFPNKQSDLENQQPSKDSMYADQPAKRQQPQGEMSSPEAQSSQKAMEARHEVKKNIIKSQCQQGTDITKFNFPGLNVFFRQGNILNFDTQALVLWQIENNRFKDKLSKEFMKTNTQFSSDFACFFQKDNHDLGFIGMTESNGTLVVVPLVAKYHTDIQDQIFATLMKLLDMVDKKGKSSVAIPRYPYDLKDKKTEVDMFAVSLYKAVTCFIKVPESQRQHIKNIHVFDPEEKGHGALIEYFEIAVSKAESTRI